MWEVVFPSHPMSQKSLERMGEDGREQKAQAGGIFLRYEMQWVAFGTAKHQHISKVAPDSCCTGSLDDRHGAIGTSSTLCEGTDVAHQIIFLLDGRKKNEEL